MGKVIIIPSLDKEYMVIANNDETKYALIRIQANALRQHQLGIFDHEPSLSECNQQIKALKELEGE